MKFTSGGRRPSIIYEKDLIEYWKQEGTFRKSVEQRSKDDAYVFYDGPPFITGLPHHGTLLSSVVKDAVPRFWTMQGKRVERVWGWDCHGLPAEVFTEKKLGIVDKRDIGTKISLEEYIVTCRDNMVTTGALWEDTIDRIGRWVEFKGAYKTMDREYMESVWWAFKQLFDKGKIYEGEKVLMYCTRDATPLSKAEIAMDNSYQDDTDPSVYVKFKLADGSGRYVVAWTTTPWTLPSNTAVAVNKDVQYAEINFNNEILIIADKLVEQVMTDEKHQLLLYEKLRTIQGSELIGLSYEHPLGLELDSPNAFKIWHADFVNDESGTGIAHESPAYGEDDYAFAKENDIPWVMSTDVNGIFTLGRWLGSNIWDVNKQIAKELLAEGIVLKIEYITHSYPHCFRCNTKLMYRAVPSWFMDVDGQRQEMLEQNADVNWYPEHIKHGRFTKNVQSAPDWNLSRDRFWATPMPVWKGIDADGKEHIKVVGSYDELKQLSGVVLDDYHRPWVDDISFTVEGVEYRRIEKVMDCWFESGSMPFAQFHYPFENVSKFQDNFPADFIVEYVPQVRAWFYYMHTVSVGLFDRPAFKNVMVTGTIAGNDGRKMSKSFGNYTDPNTLMDKYSADALRFLFLSSSLMNGEDFALADKDVADIARKLTMIWNVYDFFTLYAEVDGWEWDGSIEAPESSNGNVLDSWIISKIHTCITDVEKAMKVYDLQSATRSILPFIEDLSNWYVRRSRKRFWKAEDDSDKHNAYKTLHYTLVQLAHILAPFTPFLAEELYRKLTGGESVHLNDWPATGHINEIVVREMDAVREAVNEGLSIRAKAQVKTRQPLAEMTIQGGVDLGPRSEEYLHIIEEELNVRRAVWNTTGEYGVEIDFKLTENLIQEGIARELVRAVQSARKEAGLQVDDKILLAIHSEDLVAQKALEAFTDYIVTETLATGLSNALEQALFVTEKTIGQALVYISIQKAG